MVALMLVALLALAAPASAQLPAHLARRTIVAVRVAGETSGATTEREVGIPVGAPLTRRLLRSTVERLLATGRWADVQIDAVPEGDDVALVVYLWPRILVTRVDVEGNTVLDDGEVTSALGLGPGGELDRQDLEARARAVADAFVERGYVDARVTLRLRDTDDPGRKVLRVDVDEGEPLRIARYVFEGEPPPDAADVAGAIGLGAGDVLDRRRLRDGIVQGARRLRDQGWLEARLGEPSIERENERAFIVLPARFGPRYEVRLSGYAPLARESIEAVLRLGEERLTRSSFAAIEERVVDVLRRHGFHGGRVRVERYAGERPNTAVLDIRVRPGRVLNVVGMSFPGAAHFTSDYLRGQVISVLEEELPDTRFFTPVDSDTLDRIGFGGRAVIPRDRRVPAPLEVNPARVYYEPLYERATEHVAELFQAQGYLSVRVGPARLEPLGRGRAVVVMPVVEGPRTLLYGVALRGNTVIGDRELLEAAALRRGEPFSYLALEEAVAHMTELYRERGYLYARVEPDVRFSEDRERAEIAIRVIERFEVRFGEITIEGARRTTEGLIRDVLRFRSGEIYRPSRIRASQDALMALGIFGSVNITPLNPDLPERVKPVVITVRERSLGAFDGSIGISSGQGFRGATELDFRNVGGYALNIALRAQIGFQFFFQDDELARNISPLSLGDRLERRFAVTFALPHLPFLQDVRTSLDFVHLRDNERAFGLDKNGVVLSFNWRPERTFSLTLSGELEHNGVQLFGDREDINDILDPMEGPPPDPRIVRLLRVPQGESFVVSARATGTLDYRDSPFAPTRGWFTSLTTEWVRTIDVPEQDPEQRFFSHFLKLGLTASAYLPIGDVVLAGQLRIGGIIHLEPGSRTYPNRQWFLGGVDTLRGLNQDQLQPQDIAALQLQNPDLRTGTVLQGGDFFYLVRAELRFPIVGSLQGAVFADLGNHWADPAQITLDENFVRPTGGIGARFVTPVGPLAFDVGFNPFFRELLNEPWIAFHFSIGVF
jgi:outer membrane protein assembly factor BamA